MYAPARSLPHCSHTQQADNLHIFTFHSPSRRAVDEWLLYLDSAYASLKTGEVMRFMVQYQTRGIPHLSYGTQRVRQWLQQHPDHAPIQCAFMHNSYALASILDGVTRLLNVKNSSIRFFHETQRAKALDWLSSNLTV